MAALGGGEGRRDVRNRQHGLYSRLSRPLEPHSLLGERRSFQVRIQALPRVLLYGSWQTSSVNGQM